MASIENNDNNLNNLHKKEIFTDDEKQMILDRLNDERRVTQKAFKGLDGKDAKYDEEEKHNILSKLNEQRLSAQKREEIKEKRLHNKEVYTFAGKKFYKFLQMEREYFIEISDCDIFSRRPAVLSLYYRTFEELKRKDVLIKTEVYSEKIFISYDVIRVYFKGYALEDSRKK
ncbi:MAG: hypothetical protein GQ531_05325 [Sulfurovum sp.]|nr:hypothetical protein [Sulfurovum sp.]